MKRITSIDFCRGIVMIIMALDHTRDMMHISGVTQNPTDLRVTTAAIFFTRWITHLCAPTFVFLSGVSAYIFVSTTGTKEGRNFLLSRGLWLMLLEFTVVNFGLWFDIGFHTLISEVIAAIGFGFVVLSLTIKLPLKAIGFIGVIIIFLHNLFPLIPFAEGSILKQILSPFFTLTIYQIDPQHVFLVGYSPIPWLGIMLTGFASGYWFTSQEINRKKLFLRVGLGVLILFVVLRFLNFYGDFPWSTQKNFLFTCLSFINITKYPPSLMFILLTVGIMFLILSAGERIKGTLSDIALTYGRVPLFYFVVHLYLVHALMFVMVFLQGFHWRDLNFGPFGLGRPQARNGVDLVTTYLIWIGVVLVLYPACRWYGKYKAAHKENKWLKYL
jgi:uncharacterized membrane protein